MPDSAVSIPEEFLKVIKDFVKDMKTTFPEYETVINSWWKTSEDFISIEDLTNAQLVEWVKAALGEENVLNIENSIAELISEKENPVSITMTIEN